MKQRVLNRISESAVPLTARQLSEAIEAPLETVQAALEALAGDGRIARTRKGGWALPARVGLSAARAFFQRNGTAMAQPLEGGSPMQIEYGGAARCLPGDLLMVRPMGERCLLNAILKRGTDRFAAYLRIVRKPAKAARRGRPEQESAAGAVPCDARVPYDVVVTGDLSGARNDEIALLRIVRYPEMNRPIYACVERVLGGEGSLGALMKAVAENHAFATVASEDVEQEARELPADVRAEDLIGREDLRGMMCFTIDGATAKDFDDAVSIGRSGDVWCLGVHIADVSHYVREGGEIDRDARERGTSLYLPGLTVPMLPERLSNDLCSLMPQVDRLALSLFMEIEQGRVIDHRLVRSVIHSRARLTYQQVNRMYQGGESGIPGEIRRALSMMLELSHELRARRRAAGAIEFEMDEPEFILNEAGEPTEIILEPRGEAERVIEDFMLAANETVAALARSTELPFVYRVHEKPSPDKLLALEAFLGSLGLYARIGPQPHPGVLQAVLEQAKDHPARDVIRHDLLRAMKRARYSGEPLGHYALSAPDYCHFTSPIRRYPDLTVHRILKLLIDGELEKARQWSGLTDDIAAQCSDRENAAVSAERQADGIMTAAWMYGRIGSQFDGVVSSVTGWGMYVTLANGAEGLVHVSSMDDYYEFDRASNRLLGSAAGACFRPGDRVRVRVERVNVPLGEINFELVARLPERD